MALSQNLKIYNIGTITKSAPNCSYVHIESRRCGIICRIQMLYDHRAENCIALCPFVHFSGTYTALCSVIAILWLMLYSSMSTDQ